MKKSQIPEGIKPLFLIVPLLLSACHTVPPRPGFNNVTTAGHVQAVDIDSTKSLFPLGNYPQSVDKWIPPGHGLNVPVMTTAAQQRHFSDLKSRYFGMGPGGKSPWNPSYIVSILSKGAEVARDTSIRKYLGKQSISWGENFRVHPKRWKLEVRDNAATGIDRVYHSSGRGIVVREMLVRVLPTADPAYDDPRQAGQGYPFDNLQMSSVRPGPPVYVLAVSRDRQWKYVLSPTITGWVHNEDIAEVDKKFVTEWLTLADKSLGAFIKEPVSVHERGQYYFTARPGTILPFRNRQPGFFDVTVPVRKSDGSAQIRQVRLKDVFCNEIISKGIDISGYLKEAGVAAMQAGLEGKTDNNETFIPSGAGANPFVTAVISVAQLKFPRAFFNKKQQVFFKQYAEKKISCEVGEICKNKGFISPVEFGVILDKIASRYLLS